MTTAPSFPTRPENPPSPRSKVLPANPASTIQSPAPIAPPVDVPSRRWPLSLRRAATGLPTSSPKRHSRSPPRHARPQPWPFQRPATTTPRTETIHCRRARSCALPSSRLRVPHPSADPPHGTVVNKRLCEKCGPPQPVPASRSADGQPWRPEQPQLSSPACAARNRPRPLRPLHTGIHVDSSHTSLLLDFWSLQVPARRGAKTSVPITYQTRAIVQPPPAEAENGPVVEKDRRPSPTRAGVQSALPQACFYRCDMFIYARPSPHARLSAWSIFLFHPSPVNPSKLA